MEDVRSDIVLSCQVKDVVSWTALFKGFICQLKHRQRRNGTHQSISLPNLVRRLLQAPLRRVYPSIALVDVFLQIAHVVVLEAVLVLLPLRQPLVLGLESFGMHLGTRPKVLLGVGEEVVRTRAGDVGPADFGVVERELLGARRGGRAHELLEQLSCSAAMMEVRC